MSVNYNHRRIVILTSILVGLFAFVSDQIAKLYVVDYFVSLHSKALINLMSHLSISLAWNNGISFGLFSSENSSIFLPFLTIIILLLLCYYFMQKKGECDLIYPSLAIIIGGAMGNFADRIYYGAVVDYIDIYYKQYHFPTFNLADTYIFIGALCLFFFDVMGGNNASSSK